MLLSVVAVEKQGVHKMLLYQNMKTQARNCLHQYSTTIA
jgi:hypothetical protein